MPIRVLVIEDSPVDRELVRHALHRLDPPAGPAEIVSAGDWSEAAPRLEDGGLDLVLLDFMLPTLSGLEILAELRSRPHPPVIVISAQDDLTTAIQTLRAGAHDYVPKCGDWGTQLRQAVERVLMRANLEHEFAESHTHLLGYAAALERKLVAQGAGVAVPAEELEELFLKTEETARMKAEIVANVSHELRTPLNSVLGYADLLEDHLPRDGARDAHQILSELRRQAERLNAVVASVLSVERLRSARESVSVSPFALAGLAEELRADAMVLNADKGLAIGWRVPRKNAQVEHDREKIRAIAAHLLSNAIKFTPAGSVQVEIARTDAGGVILTVEDTGIGFPPAARTLIFEDFVQLDGSSTRRYGGLGLGLGIVKRYAALLRGTVQFTSVPGKGTTVRVELPPPATRRKRLH